MTDSTSLSNEFPGTRGNILVNEINVNSISLSLEPLYINI